MGAHMRHVREWSPARKMLAASLVILTLAVGILIGTVMNSGVAARPPQGASDASPLAIPNPVQISTHFASIANRVEPAVVNISTIAVSERSRAQTQTPRRRTPQGPQGNDPLQDFFDRFFEFPDDRGRQADRNLGSGVIVDPKGFILTNNHVVEQATRIKVRMYGDPTSYDARVIGTDPDTDLAVIKIDAKRDLPVAKLGNSDAVQVGEWVMAFGSPFGLEATVTAGIISAKDRTGIGQQFQRFLQTDAAINPGNSGGPLVSMAGEVIGINTAIFTTSRGFDGVGFALPSSTAISVYNQLVKTGRVVRGSIGITFEEGRSQNTVVLESLGAPYGIIVEEVASGSPAEAAGLRAGDVITHVNGNPVRSGEDLVNPIVATPIGGKVKVDFVREKKKQSISVSVEDRNKLFGERAATARENEQSPEAVPVRFGLRVEALTPELARRVGYEGRGRVMVLEVEPASFGEDVNLARGDIVVEINSEAINSLEDFNRVMSRLKAGQNAVFHIQRRGQGGTYLNLWLGGAVPNGGQ